jgi:lysophospholipase L1-like esterase
VAEAKFRRYAALGDSFTEGVGDEDERFPNGLRGWADRVAEQFALSDPEFRYANLAIRGRLLRRIADEQVEAALALNPDLVTIDAGGNDLLRPAVDLDALAERYDGAIARLTQSGAKVLVFNVSDLGGGKVAGSVLRGRFAIFNALVAEIADRHGATLVDVWRMREYRDPRLWAFDRIHLSAAGHELMAARVLDLLGVPHAIEPADRGPIPQLTPAQARGAQLKWTREFLVPWIARRVRGVSSGDGVEPKRPAMEPVGVGARS